MFTMIANDDEPEFNFDSEVARYRARYQTEFARLASVFPAAGAFSTEKRNGFNS